MTDPTLATGKDGKPELRFDGVGQAWTPADDPALIWWSDAAGVVDKQGRLVSCRGAVQPDPAKRPQLVPRP